MPADELRKNIIIYYLYTIFSNLLILGPIIIIYYEAKGLNFTQIMLLASVSSVSTVLFEVPTGAVADKLGRKLSMTAGVLLWGISLIIYVFGRDFYAFSLAEVIFALGGAFISGADTALLYDSLKAQGMEGEFQRIEGKAKSYSFYAQALGSVAAGFLFKINIEFPMIVSAIFMIVTAFITMNFKEPPISDKKGKYGEKYLKLVIESGKYILSHEKLKALILYAMVFFVFYRGGFFMFQPYFKEVNIPVEYYGIIFFLFNIVAGIASKNSHKIMEKTKRRTLTFLSSIMIVSFLILGVTRIWIGFAAIFLQQMARGLYHPITRKYLNKNIPSDKRATILSFFSLLTNLAAAIAYPLFGMLKDSADIFTTHMLLASVMAVLTFLTSIYMKGRLGTVSDNVQQCGVSPSEDMNKKIMEKE